MITPAVRVPSNVMGRAPTVLLAFVLVAVASLGAPASAKDRPANSKPEPRVSDPNDPSSFHFMFRSLTDRAGPNLYVYMYMLRVDGASGRVVMLLNRNGADHPGLPAGLFATTLSKEQATALREAVEGIKWNELPELRGGDVSAAALSLDYSRGSRIIQRSFNAYNGEFLNAISTVMSQVTDLGIMLTAHPMRAIRVELVGSASGFRLILRNVGSGPVVIADPRQPDRVQGRPTERWAWLAMKRFP